MKQIVKIKRKLAHMQLHSSKPVITNRVDTGVIGTGREGDDMWRSKKYSDEEFKKDLLKSTTRDAQK